MITKGRRHVENIFSPTGRNVSAHCVQKLCHKPIFSRKSPVVPFLGFFSYNIIERATTKVAPCEIFNAIDGLEETFHVKEDKRERGKKEIQSRRGRRNQLSAEGNSDAANGTRQLGAGGGGGKELRCCLLRGTCFSCGFVGHM